MVPMPPRQVIRPRMFVSRSARSAAYIVSSLAASLVIAACSRSAAERPPETRKSIVVDTIHGVAVEDRYRWLEQQDSPEVLAWIEAQRQYAEKILGPENADRTAIHDRLTQLMDVPNMSAPRRGGDWEYFTLRRVGEPVAALYRRKWSATPSPIVPDSQYELVINPLTIRDDGTTAVGVESISPDGKLLLYSVRDGGPDEITLHVRDLATGTDLPDSLPNALYASLSFTPDNHRLYYVHRSRTIGPRFKKHILGTDVGVDSVLFGDSLPPTHFLGVSFADGGRYRLFTVSHGWAQNEVFVQDMKAKGKVTNVTEGTVAHFAPQLVDGALWMKTDFEAPRGRLVSVDLANPRRDRWRVVIPEGEDVMDSFTQIDGKIYVTYLHNASQRIAVYTPKGEAAGEVEVPSQSSVSIRGSGKGKAMLTASSFGVPSTTWEMDLAKGTRSIWEESKVPVDTSKFEQVQLWATSKDGTKVPMWVLRQRGKAKSADTPALLTGYGGFTLSLLPRFDARAAYWVERGGIFVQATLRGGNDFGEDWHKAGMLKNKQHVFDDFLAVAQFLVDSGYTSPEKFTIRGVSNAGLLMGAAITQRPDLFRAAFVGYPDLDIVRFPQFATHNNAPALLEYGDARHADQFPAILGFSPYQKIKDGTKYPAVLVQTGINDTRVPPWQARRFAARLQEATTSGRPVILLHDLRSGHSGGRSNAQSIELASQEMEFLLRQVGSIQ